MLRSAFPWRRETYAFFLGAFFADFFANFTISTSAQSATLPKAGSFLSTARIAGPTMPATAPAIRAFTSASGLTTQTAAAVRAKCLSADFTLSSVF